MTEGVNFVTTTVRWSENGNVQERKMQIAEGYEFNFEKSGKSFKARKGENAVLSLSKEEAYNLLGLSHASETEAEKKAKAYVLDEKDLNVMRKDNSSDLVDNITKQHVSRAGYGARVIDVDLTTAGGLNIYHYGKNNRGQNEEYKISVFYNKK